MRPTTLLYVFWHNFLHKGFLELADSNIMDGGHDSLHNYNVSLNAIYMDKCKCSCYLQQNFKCIMQRNVFQD